MHDNGLTHRLLITIILHEGKTKGKNIKKEIFFELMIKTFVVLTIIKTWSLNNLILFKKPYSYLPIEHACLVVDSGRLIVTQLPDP